MEAKTKEIYGLSFFDGTLKEAVAFAREKMKSGAVTVATPNPEILWRALKDPALYHALKNASLLLPDGVGVIFASKILKKPLAGKIAGVEFGEAVLAAAAQNGESVYFLGGKAGVAEKAAEKMSEKYPGFRVAGCGDGYFQNDGEAFLKIKESGAEIAFLCLGFPKQEILMEKHRGDGGAALSMALGGSLDVYAGTAKRAPGWMIRLNLEWFYRLLSQPSRLGRMMKIPLFLLYTVKCRFFGWKQK